MEDGQVMLYSVSLCILCCIISNFIVSLTNFQLASLCCFQSSVNGKEAKIPFPWLVFNEKVKVNSVFLRDSTAISDSILLLFGGNIKQGGLVCSFTLPVLGKLCFRLANVSLDNFCCTMQDGHLKMLGGYLEFFMSRDLASTYLSLKNELENLIHCKVFASCSVLFYTGSSRSYILLFLEVTT